MNSPQPVYREIPPPPGLADLVDCCWIHRGHAGPASSGTLARILPDGCMDILLTLGDFPEAEGGRPPTERASVVGTMTRAQVFTLRGRLDMVAVRFKPGGARPFLRVAADALVNVTAPLDALWGPSGSDLAERVGQVEGDEARAGLLFSELGVRRSTADAPDALVASASRLIDRSRGRLTMTELRHALGVGERTLERRFRREVGISPKRAAGVARLQAATAALSQEPSVSVGGVAHACGFYDQAHFTREFKALAGVTPGKWRTAERA